MAVQQTGKRANYLGLYVADQSTLSGVWSVAGGMRMCERIYFRLSSAKQSDAGRARETVGTSTLY